MCDAKYLHNYIPVYVSIYIYLCVNALCCFLPQLIIHLLPYVQSCVNPIVYSFMSNNFRSSFRSQCRRLWRHCCCLPCHPRGHHPRGATPSYRKDVAFDMESLDKWSTVGGGGAKHQSATPGATCMSVLSEV